MRYLHKHFAGFDQTQFIARALLNRLRPRFQVANFRIKAGVTLFKLAVDAALRFQFLVILPDAKPTALAQPQRILQQGNESDQNPRRPAHGLSGRKLFAQVVEDITPRIDDGIAQILFDTQQLVVLGDTIRAAERTSLYLTRIKTHSDISDG